MNDESSPISPRRRLLEEVLEERSKAVATLPVIEEDPHPSSWLWPVGISRLVLWCPRDLEERRCRALDVAVVALAWLESIDAALEEGGVS